MKKKILTVVFLIVFGLSGLQAQKAVLATGGDASGSGGSVSYSVGQLVYTINTGTGGAVAQGVQQPYEISAITGIEETGISLEMSVYPNPATKFVKLKVESKKLKKLSYQLYDINGKLLDSEIIKGNETTINMGSLTPSTYFLRVVDNNRVIKSFKIIKN